MQENRQKNRIVAIRTAPYLFLVLVILLAYADIYHNEFLFDDLFLITGNRFLGGWHDIGAMFTAHLGQGHDGAHSPFYRPLQLLLYLFVYQAAGPSTIAFHLLNLTLHALNACLLYALGPRLGFQRIAALLAAVLWALHPVQTEAVTYMSGTADPLCGVFLLSGVFVLASGFTTRRVLAACLLFMLALLSKETGVIFPLLAMGLIFYQSENRWHWRNYLRSWPFWLIAVAYLLVRFTVFHQNGYLDVSSTAENSSVMDRVSTFLATLPTYLQLLVWPTGLHMERSFPVYHDIWAPPVLAGLVVAGAALAGIVWKPARRATPLAWGLLWAAALEAPQSGIVMAAGVRGSPVLYEHWLYLPTLGLTLGLAESLARGLPHLRIPHLDEIAAGVALCLAGVLGLLTFKQNQIWHDPISFYGNIFANGEESVRARNNLGLAYLQAGQYDLAIRQYRMALAAAPDDPDAHHNLGMAIITQDHTPPALNEGIAHLERAIALNPDDYNACDFLAYVYANLGDPAKAAAYRGQAAVIRQRLGLAGGAADGK